LPRLGPCTKQTPPPFGALANGALAKGALANGALPNDGAPIRLTEKVSGLHHFCAGETA